MKDTTGDKSMAGTEPRLLRFMVNGRPFYAMKWRDERTENRREVDYVMREAGVAETFCLLVDCPLRIPGTPDVVSVETSGRTITRAETTWDISVTVWEDGATDDEALVRCCHPDCFPRHGDLLVRDLKRMIREYRQGTRECHDLVPSTRLVDPKPKAFLEAVAEKVDAIHATAGAIHADTQLLKVAVPAVINGQAKTIRDHEKELDRLNVILSQKIADLFVVYQEIDPDDMKIFLSFFRAGNQVKAAADVGMKEQTLRARVAKWPRRGAAYARIAAVYQHLKKTPRKPKMAPNYDKTLFENLSGPDPDVDAHILSDIAEIIQDMTPANLEVKRKELLSKYLAAYTST
jgi:DNA-binding protein Fis